MVQKQRSKTIVILKRKKTSEHDACEEYFSCTKEVTDSVDEEYLLRSLDENTKSQKTRQSGYTKGDLQNAIAELAARYGKRSTRRDCGKLDKVGLREIALKYNIPKSTLQDRFGKYKGERILSKGEFILILFLIFVNLLECLIMKQCYDCRKSYRKQISCMLRSQVEIES